MHHPLSQSEYLLHRMNLQGKILIADDDASFRDLLSAILTDAGHEVIAVEAKAEAYDRVVVEQPDIVLSDINAPTMHGFQFIDWLLASPATSRIPVLFVSGFSDEETIRAALDRGAVGYITKPFDVQRLLATMIRVMQEYPVVRWDQQAPFPDNSGEWQEIQYREWPFFEGCVENLILQSPVRALLMQRPQDWTLDVLVEAGTSLVGLRILRTYDRNPVPHYHVHAFKRALQSAGLERGILYTLLEPTPFARLSARLLGIELKGLPDTARLLRAGFLAGQHTPHSCHPFGEIVRRTETSLVDARFAPFVRRLREELETLNNSTLAVRDERPEGLAAGERLVFLNVTDDGTLTFTASNPSDSFQVSQNEFYDLLARLWLQRRLTTTELSTEAFDRSCLLALFPAFPPCAARNRKSISRRITKTPPKPHAQGANLRTLSLDLKRQRIHRATIHSWIVRVTTRMEQTMRRTDRSFLTNPARDRVTAARESFAWR